MDLVWLEDFLAIAEEGGFSRAAERRHVTQPALSRRIKSLEEWLGTQLFERSTHTITLTAAGESFRPVAEDVLRRVLVGREEALEVARLKAETITFVATHSLSQTFFPGMDPQLGRRARRLRGAARRLEFRRLREAAAGRAGALHAGALPSVAGEPARHRTASSASISPPTC